MTLDHGLGALLAPLALADFFASVWGQRHHHGSSDTPGRFAALLPDRGLEEVLSALRPQPDMLRLVRQGQPLPLSDFLLPDGFVDLVQLRNHYAGGHTIVLNGAERFVPAIRALTNAIARDSDLETQVNVYATPPRAQGFSPHFDDHDVLVLQLRGRKTWCVHLSSPLVPPEQFRLRERAVDVQRLGEPLRITLAPGDILYLPRGMIHAAETEQLASVHLTIGFHPPSLLALVCASLEAGALRGGDLLQQAAPGFLSDAARRAETVAAVHRLVPGLGSEDIERGLANFEDRLVKSGRCGISGDFVGAGEAALTPESRLRPSALLPSRLLQLEDSVALQFAQSIVVADGDHRAALAFLRACRAPFRIADLPGLGAEAQLALAEKLLEDGFLTMA